MSRCFFGMILLFSVFLTAAVDRRDRVLYDFESGTQSWWTYSKGASVLLSQGSDISNRHKGLLRVEYSYMNSGPAILGVGIDTRTVLVSEKWADYSAGGISVFLRNDIPCRVRIEFRSDASDLYAFTVSGVDDSWRKFSVPFSEFKNKENVLDLRLVRMSQIVIVPEKMDTNAHVLCVDDVSITVEPPAVPEREIKRFSGRVLGPEGMAVKGAEVFLFLDDSFTVLSNASCDTNGQYTIGGRLPKRSYGIYPDPAATTPMKFGLCARADHFTGVIEKVDNTAPLHDLLLKPQIITAAAASIPERPEMKSVSKLLLGVNLGIWSINSVVANQDMLSLMREAGVGLIRFPAGGRSDSLLWTRDNTKQWFSKPQPSDGAFEYNGYLTAAYLDKFIDLCRAINATPLFTVNGHSKQPSIAADIVKYANIEKKYAIPYWEVGNEPEAWLGWKVEALGRVVEIYSAVYEEYHRAMRSIDPSIRLMGPVSANRNFYDPVVKNFLAAYAGRTDLVSIHRYPQNDDGGKDDMDDDGLLKTSSEWTEIADDIGRWVIAAGCKERLPLAVTEWNTAYTRPGEQAIGLVAFLWNVNNIAEMALNGVHIGCYWNVIDSGNYSMLVWKDGAWIKRPAFYAFELVSRCFSKAIVRAHSTDARLKVYFGYSANSRCAVLVNNAPREAFAVSISGAGAIPENWNFKCKIFDATQRFEKYDGVRLGPDGQLKAEVSPYSVLIITLPSGK